MKKLLVIPAVLALAFALTSFGGKKDCPADGKPNPKKGKKAQLKPREKELNRHINRDTPPQPSDFDNTVGIEDMYNSKDDSIFSENKAATIVGYLFRAVSTGKASCNCYTEDQSKYSINLYISPTPINNDTRTADCIVAVITPYSKGLNADWTDEKIMDKMGSQKVKVSGWLLYDYLHGSGSIETNPNSSEPDRRTIWGICPMTAIQLMK